MTDMKKIILCILITNYVSVTSFAQETGRRTEVKSGIITLTSEFLGQELVSKRYFDDYGKRSAEYMLAPLYEGGVKRDSLIAGKFFLEDEILFVDYVHKSVGKIEGGDESINFLNLTDEVNRKHRIKVVGEETVCGKPCVRYSLLSEFNGKKTKCQVWVWRGIALKTKFFSFPFERETEAVDVRVDVPVDSSVFVIPDFPRVTGP